MCGAKAAVHPWAAVLRYDGRLSSEGLTADQWVDEVERGRHDKQHVFEPARSPTPLRALPLCEWCHLHPKQGFKATYFSREETPWDLNGQANTVRSDLLCILKEIGSVFNGFLERTKKAS